MTSLGIVAALPAEAGSLTNQPMTAGSLVRLPGNKIIRLAGIGGKLARTAAVELVAAGATALLSWGSAGALDKELLPGSLLLPKSIISSDQTIFPVDSAWHERLCHLLKEHLVFHTRPLAESPIVLSSPAEKRGFYQQCGAIAVDMESASVAEVAKEAKISFVAIRAIADPSDMTIPKSALTALDEHGRVQPLKLLRELVRRPAEIFLLIRTRNHFRSALTTLSTVAQLAGDNLLAF
ncbi:MAG: purine phosphorylase [Deltaproteobacteria bacterium]|nr:MAG: purine phosphorylase [Deltaproteobacteria bacterium]